MAPATLPQPSLMSASRPISPAVAAEADGAGRASVRKRSYRVKLSATYGATPLRDEEQKEKSIYGSILSILEQHEGPRSQDRVK